jgi:electron transfer flavoprotein alpha/beta subunit
VRFYSELSILEAIWKIVKIIKKENLSTLKEGLNLIKRDLNIAEIDENAVEIAISLYIMGHRDLIDNLLYGIAIS